MAISATTLKGYRTTIFNGALVAVPVLDQLLAAPLLTPWLQANFPVLLSLIGFANIALRWVTTSPIFTDGAQQ